MNRRDWLGLLGTSAAGLGLNDALHADDVHEKKHGAMPPIDNVHLYFCGFHIAKKNPRFQIETQHYCAVQGEEMHQCILYDKAEKTAKLLGVEYIITDKLFQGLPEEEKKYWHPHTYEVLGGQLIAPQMTQKDEDAFMKALITTWGKAIHVWPDPSTKLPVGDPLLMWSIMADGQIDPKLLVGRDERFKVNTEKISARRQKLFELPEPSVAFPKNVDMIGRQWTNQGPDTPAQRRKELEGS
ncbi:MAG: DUF1264 domain-containing protein [Gemmataceae bacterium]